MARSSPESGELSRVSNAVKMGKPRGVALAPGGQAHPREAPSTPLSRGGFPANSQPAGSGFNFTIDALFIAPKVNDAKFRQMDLNGDRVLTREEADAAFDREGSLKKLFTAIDTDGNGNLSRAEAGAFRSKVQQQPGASPAEKISNATNPS